MKYWTSRASIEEEWSGSFGILVVDSKCFFTTSRLGFRDLEYDHEVGGEGEGVLLLEWPVCLNLLAIHI